MARVGNPRRFTIHVEAVITVFGLVLLFSSCATVPTQFETGVLTASCREDLLALRWNNQPVEHVSWLKYPEAAGRTSCRAGELVWE